MTSPVVVPSGWVGYRAEADATAVADSTRELIAILDAVEIPIVVIRRNFAIMCFNRAAAEVLGLNETDIGCPANDTVALTGSPDLSDWFARAMAGSSSRHDFPYRGKAFRLRLSPYTRRDGEIGGVVLTFTNVTAFRASIEQAIHDREYIKAVLNTVPEPLVVLDAEFRIQTANRAFHAIFDVSRDNLQGSPLRLVKNGVFDIPRLNLLLMETLADRMSEPLELDSRASTAGRSFLLTARRLFLSAPSASRILLSFHDITTRKRTEEDLAKRAAEQAMLHRLTDRLYRAETLADMYEAALDAIAEALRAERAAILLFDARGVMRFVAWRGLSDAYRAAVEGHSPWNRGDSDPQPIWVPDIETAAESDSLKATIRAEGIRALSFMPLLAHGALIGKFMTYYEAPHAFSNEEIGLAFQIARQLGFSIERKRADEARATLAAIVASSQDAIISMELNGIIASWNGGAERIFGYKAEEAAGNSITLLIPRERVEDEHTILSRIRRGEHVEHFETIRRRKDGSLVDVSLTVSPIRDARGRIVGASKIAREITDRKLQEKQQTILVNELNHRVKNTLATVQSIASQTLRNSDTTEQADKLISGRLVALAKAHDVLTQRSWEGAPLRQLVEQAVAPHCVPGLDRFVIEGPDVWMSPKNALAITMALHELCTNAVKYGALSTNTGHIEVVWTIADRDGQPGLRLCWSEVGGPVVGPPSRRGFGSRLIEAGLSQELGGDVHIEFNPAGVICTLVAPLGTESLRHR
jgi:two-component system, chemotaxis family, CheB/CheR fusion protein